MRARTVPLQCGNEEALHHGKVTVQEVGHWFRLFHTFENDDCNGEEDMIEDTPSQASRTNFNRPIGRDSCPDKPGMDPVRNFMDYSSEECHTEFTSGQAARMYELFKKYRAQPILYDQVYG
ncbi:hypothetical protein QQS21_004776 [Conoideocrella luteorostrata]|uniref:Peptidase M43 pregnancy-associated plasma-A domain-containing protein n=1 Tax=Conoideocrella luteorostrata TaxID=1105319 RepID=A0AAJ0CTP2_9HYPO|nr:hypothetical protein QQS21_004776 [Conoideocrella luteorostrata]